MISALLSPVPEGLYTPDPAPGATTALRYLGTAGFVVESGQSTVVIDPFVSRPGVWQTALRPLRPDTDRIRRYLPRADHVLIGHAHFDHVLDGPELCRQTGARFIGSPASCNVARAAGLPESQIRETRSREDIACGPFLAHGLPSRHGRVYRGKVSLPGDIPAPPAWPARFHTLRHGLVLNWYLEVDGLRLLHIDSADFIDEELRGRQADVVCLCAIGRAYRPNYVQAIVDLLGPRYIVACHWDYFFTPYEAPPRQLPYVDLPGFVEEIKAAGVTPIVLPFEGRMGLQA